MNKFTGNKDVDFIILNKLNDIDLSKVCQVNKYANSLCDDDTFWRNRIKDRYKFILLNDLNNIKQYLYFNSFKEIYIWSIDQVGWGNLLEHLKYHKFFDKLFEFISTLKFPNWINKEEFPKYLLRKLYFKFRDFYTLEFTIKYMLEDIVSYKFYRNFADPLYKYIKDNNRSLSSLITEVDMKNNLF